MIFLFCYLKTHFKIMENITKQENRIFLKAFTGVVLLVISIMTGVAAITGSAVNESFNLVAAALAGVTATALLSDAIRKDRHRII